MFSSSHFLSLLLLLNSFILHAIPSNTLSVESAEKAGLIKLLIKSKGGYTGSVIQLFVSNLSNQLLRLKVESGRRLDSRLEEEQDILITHEQMICLYPNGKTSCVLSGMCCQAHHSAPSAGSVYSVGKMADSALVLLARFIDQHDYENQFAAQEAVWTISDGNSLGSIGSDDPEIVKQLQGKVAEITGRKIPPYVVRYGNGTSTDLLGKPTSIKSSFAYDLPSNGRVRLAIYDAAGHMVQLLFDDLGHEKGSYVLYYTFRTVNLPAGKYTAKMELDGNVQKTEDLEL